MQHKALEKKSNIEYLEQVGWQQFLPKFVIEGIPVCFVNLHCMVLMYVSQSVHTLHLVRKKVATIFLPLTLRSAV